ncbi:hypothetical protein [Pedobacter glucosidilyticus]|uniref:hypothetical protein n=1 Tax=Pedobacter glucosidilyticus TaxID=1122941 RepID=UPI0012DFD8A6|nr:hypothetical protein [Pedobacter glucosidilyticus]
MKTLNVILLLLLCGCSLKKGVSGKYYKSPNAFQFYSDSTFRYEYKESHLYKYSTGNWKQIDKGLISLNSTKKFGDIPLEVHYLDKDKESDRNEISIKIDLKGRGSLSDYICRIMLNDKIYTERRCDSLAYFYIKEPIKSLYLQIINEPVIAVTTYVPFPLITEIIYPKNTIGNNINLTLMLDASNFYYKCFDNDILEVKRKSVKIYNPDRKKWEEMPRVSNQTQIFSRFLEANSMK